MRDRCHIRQRIKLSSQYDRQRSGGTYGRNHLLSWHCPSISLMALLLLVSPLIARALPLRYSVPKRSGRYLAMLVL